MKNDRKIMSFLSLVIIISVTALNLTNTAFGANISSSYLYFGDKSTFEKNIDNTKGTINVVYPSYFDLNSDGSLRLTDKVDKSFVDDMHSKNIKVVPFLSNHWNQPVGRNALYNREALVNQLVEAITKYDLDGINVDIENVTEKDKADYVDLVKRLKESLPQGKEVSVAVAANPKGWKTGWQASYDYENLAKYSDYLFVMTYDESYEGSKAGPIASISFVENSIKYALKYVSSDKIVLGLPFYGRYWKVGSASGGSGLSLKKINSIVNNYGAAVTYDSVSKSPKAIVNQEDGQYIYWYENDASIKEKLKLVKKYNLRGSGSWSLGQELTSLWDNYGSWLKGKYFADVDNHWAENDIYLVEEKGWMNGVALDLFAPNVSLTRAQAAVIIIRALGINETVNTNSFNDVDSSYWASKEIELSKKYNILVGKVNNNFKPDDLISREEMAVLLDRLTQKSDIAPLNNFKDITASDWAYNSILKMNGYGIIKGYEDNKFYPKQNITRAQMAALMNRISVNINEVKARMQ